MKIAGIHLENYIGIYNGMGLREITIDFSIGSHRTVVIRGDNGSGKSTIMKALSIFPDGNEMFIPGEPAKKEIVVVDGETIYTLTFIHAVKPNGQRDTTKAYIKKNVAGIVSELNDNGNVSSFKDIIYSELSLDPSFESLSQLSTEDRGIADKKPADRKRFVNKILDNLEIYNDIYKTLTKRSSGFKNLINSIVAKLNIIGSPEAVAASIKTIETQLSQAQDTKDRLIEKLATQKATISMLDPDGTISTMIDDISKQNQEAEEKKTIAERIIMKEKLAAGIDALANSQQEYDTCKAKIDKVRVDNQVLRGQIETLLKEQETSLEEKTRKLNRLESFDESSQYEKIADTIAIEEQAIEDMKSTISDSVGIIDPSIISKEGFIAALNALKSIVDIVSVMRESCDYTELDLLLDLYIRDGKLPNPISQKSLNDRTKEIHEEIQSLTAQITKAEIDLKKIEVLELRPGECTINSCPFVAEAISIEKTDPKRTLSLASEQLDSVKRELEQIQEQLHMVEARNYCISQFSNLIRSIDGATKLVQKFPFANLFTDKKTLISNIFRNNLDSTFNQIYGYIDIANIFDEYRNTLEGLTKLKAELEVYESKHQVIDEIEQDLRVISTRLDEIQAQVIPIQSRIANNDRSIVDLENKLSRLSNILEREKSIAELEETIKRNTALYNENIVKIKQIKAAFAIASKIADEIEETNRIMKPLSLERDRLNHQLRMIDEYRTELDQLNKQYNWLELIRKYSSPTTGIQLWFMQAYMENIIKVANDLLAMFFGGSFKIMPFIINETEFRIPCAGEGIMNDDISSMSSAQIAMISMILSFSFLYNSSSRFNILKLDEIDGPLDGNNRIMFIDVLNQVMDMMHVEQCIMISHNSELQVENADIILLRSSENNMYEAGNIIWKF